MKERDRWFLATLVALVVIGVATKGCASYVNYRRDVEVACLKRGGTITEANGDNHLRCVRQLPVDSVEVKR